MSMRKCLPLLILMLNWASTNLQAEGAELLLARDGKTEMPIVISATAINAREDYRWGYFTPTTGERQVALELAEILGRITGADFPVVAVGTDWTLIASGGGNARFDIQDPRAIAVDATDRVYVAEMGQPGTVTVFNASAAGETVFPLQTTGGVHFPVGIDISGNGEVAVAVRTGTGRGEIQLFDPLYRFQSRIALDDHGGIEDLAYDADGNLWVTSHDDFKVRQFSRAGKVLLTIPNRPGMKRDYWYFPSGIDVDAQGRVLVSDFHNVVRFDPRDYRTTMELFAGLPGSSAGTAAGEFAKQIGGIAIGTTGHVYIADRGNARIQVFDAAGTFAKILGHDLLQQPDDVALNQQGDACVAYGAGENSEVCKFLATPLKEIPARAIVLGTLENFPQPHDPTIARALRVGEYFDGVESYVIRTTPNRLLLLGAKPLGVSHAASAFLERLGYRFFFPGEHWEIVPQQSHLQVKMHVDERPDFLAYQALYGFGGFANDKGRCLDDYNRWMRRNRKGLSLPVKTGHSWQQIISDHQAEFNAHPEYFALVKGKRDVRNPIDDIPKLCVSNPAVVELCRQWAREYFAKHPKEEMVSMDPSDYNGPVGHCECDQCARIGTGTSSDKVFFLVNEVAREVAPLGKMVGCLAYEHHSDIPSFSLEKNVYVQLTRIFIRGEHSYDELVEQWPTKAAAVGFYDYWSVFHWTKNMLPSRYGNNVSYLTHALRDWHEKGGTSLNPEISNSWGINGRGWYLAAHLRWDTQRDVDAFLDDFYSRAFGPAAETMQTYYERLDWGKLAVFNDHVVALAFRDLRKASEQATHHPEVLARLGDLKLYMHYFHLKWQFDHEEETATREKLGLDILKHGYKSRHTYMFDWAWLSKWWIGKITTWDPRGKVGDAVTWAYSNPTAPWRDESNYTHEEIEDLFQRDLEAWQPKKDLVERTFSNDLVPVQFSEFEAKDAQQYAMWTGDGVFTLRYALYSEAGEDLQFSISTGIYYTDKPPLRYQVFDAEMRLIQQGSLPQDKAEHAVGVSVSRPGLYHLEVQDNGAGWTFRSQRDRPASVQLQGKSVHHNHQGGQRWFFYVPKGTKRFDYYPGNDLADHQVTGPNDEAIATVVHDGKIKTIQVPADLDGALWSFGDPGHLKAFQPRELWFYNLPNWLSSARNALLVPREIALRDGLKIR